MPNDVVKPDPARYERMNQPHEHQAACADAVDAFFRAVETAREVHKIANVLVVIHTPFLESEGEVTDAATSLFLGDSLKAERMAAWALGQESARRQEQIATLMRKGGGVSYKRGK